MRNTLLAIAIHIAAGCTGMPAQAAGTGWPEIETAVQAQRWPEAMQRLESYVREHPADPNALVRMAVVHMHLKQLRAAADALRRAQAMGFAPGVLAYRKGQLQGLQGDANGAFMLLGTAVEQGLPPNTSPQSDPLLEPLRQDARFAGFIERYEKAVHPCAHDPRYRALDYWVGTWDVRRRGAAPDSPASENIITAEYEGCVVMEHWRSTNGGTGSSFNIFDVSRGQWFQTWVDSGGGLHEYRGNPDAQGNLVFTGEAPGDGSPPTRTPTRLTLFKLGPDSVRQFSESSTDGGKTWTVNYDLIYTRRGSPTAAH